MRHADLARLAAAVREPIQAFVRDSRARIALLVNGAGQVVAQHGFAGGYEVMNVASLAAAAHAASQALARLTGAGRWTHLYHAGAERQLFLAPLRTAAETDLILVVIFDGDSSLGIVQLFCGELQQDVLRLPGTGKADLGSTASSFERDLEAGLDLMSRESAGEG